MIKNILFLSSACLLLASCKKEPFAPLNDNHRTLRDIYNNPGFAEGVLMNAYSRMPVNGFSFNDAATDDAVSNDKNNGYLRMATGQWSSIYNPADQWNNSLAAISYTNFFLQETDSVNWAPVSGKDTRMLYNDRHKGEAYGLRALFMFYLLQAHGGYNDAGQLLGVPILTSFQEPNADFRLPRNTFDECMQQLYRDIDEALKYLPLDYVDVSSTAQMPEKYRAIPVGEYNRVFGFFNMQRMSGRIARAIRAKAALLAASPAFSTNTPAKWETAANYLAEVLNLNGGLAGLHPNGWLFYTPSEVNAVDISTTTIKDDKESLWRGHVSVSNTLERDMFPPTLFGNGRINPTQNLVDAFPMANGLPITDPASGYNAATPYANRDPRLQRYIVVNGSSLRNTAINVYDGAGNNAVDFLPTSTRTGYYLRKLLRDDVNLAPNSTNTQKHFVPRIRYTELYLSYAEAANEAWGPDAVGNNGFASSARDIVAAIRKRVGIAQPDNYLASVATKEDMRKMIHNERRLELCFEGHRFWDLRRWREPINAAARGVRITQNGTQLTFNYGNVENRQFANHMYYGPVPFDEVLKLGLTQNNGW